MQGVSEPPLPQGLDPGEFNAFLTKWRGEVRERPVIASLRLLTVLNVGFKSVGARHAVPVVAERRAPCTDWPVTHFALPPGEKRGLAMAQSLALEHPCRARFGAANTRVSEKTGDCPKRRARATRFILNPAVPTVLLWGLSFPQSTSCAANQQLRSS